VLRGFNLSAGSQQLILDKVDTNILIDRMVFFTEPSFDPSSYDYSQQDVVIISEQPLSQEAVSGSPVTMGVSVISTSSLSYQWYKDGNPIENAQTQTLLFQSSNLNDSGAYQVEIQSESSTVMSANAHLVVSPALPTTPFSVRSFELTVVGDTPTVVFDAVGFENSRIQVQVSPDLIEWEDLGPSVIPTGPISIEDSAAASASERYYRLILTPLL